MATDPAPGVARAARWRRWGIRRQLTLLATVAATIPMLLGTFLLATLLHERLASSLTSAAQDETARLASLVATFGPSVVADPDQLADGYEAQVLDPFGRVLATWNRSSTAPLSSLRPEPGQVVTDGISPWWTPVQAEETFVVVASGVQYHGSNLVVVVAASHAAQHEAVTTVVRLLLTAIPFLVALVAVATNLLVRRALAPVGEMADRVGTITLKNLSERVPEPARIDELGRLSTTMNSMLERLESSQQVQRRFVSDASHELRSPLTTLSGAIELGESAHDERTWSELAPLMRAETTRLQALVGDLLVLSRFDDRGLMTLGEVDLDDLLDEEARRLRDSGTKEIRREVRATRIVGDRDMLLRALRNLDDNAMRHASHVILHRLSPLPDGGVRIEVADDGQGISEADRTRVFERFVRLDESRSRDSGGGGLGLPIVAEVAHAHGGTVTVGESTLGGASFVIRLPARPTHVERMAQR